MGDRMEFGKVSFQLRRYIDSLKEGERNRRRSERRRVPTNKDFYELIGMTATGFSRITQNHVDRIDKAHIAAILYVFHKHGFDTTIDDFMVYIPPEVDG
jgi:hypothetical protein